MFQADALSCEQARYGFVSGSKGLHSSRPRRSWKARQCGGPTPIDRICRNMPIGAKIRIKGSVLHQSASRDIDEYCKLLAG